MVEATVASLQASTTTTTTQYAEPITLLRILEDRIRARRQWREGRGKEGGLRVPPAPLGAFRLRTRHPSTSRPLLRQRSTLRRAFIQDIRRRDILWEEAVGSWRGYTFSEE